MDAVTAAFSHFFDYAGLFPPAGLPLDEAAHRYGRYRAGPHAWMLGRLIVPAERVAEASAAAARAGASAGSPWPLSVLAGPPAHGHDTVERVRPYLVAGAPVRVEAVEAVAATVDDIAQIAGDWPRDLPRYVEIAAAANPTALIAALSAHGLHAKIRAGGVVAGRFPSPAEVARFLVRAHEAGVAIKATAGLHHAIRGGYRLTYEAGSASATMHGFVNLLLAATLLAAGRIDENYAEACLDDDRPEAFKLSGRAGSWLNGVVTYGEIADARRALLHSVGTCSFEEPVAEIEALDFGLKGVDGA
jgi:hypothetical protein